MISQSKKFRFKDPSAQCSAKQKLAEIIVNANSPVQMVFYIATLPTNTGSESLEYPKNTPKTTTPVQVTPGKMFQECLDPKKTYLLVIMDSSGGLSKIDRYGKGSWELKWNGNTKKPQANYSRHVQTHLFGAPRSCDIQSNLFSVFVRTDANPEQTRWVLWNNTFPEEGFINYTRPNVLTVWEKCIPEVKHSFSIYDSAADGFSAGPNDVGFYAVFLNGSLRGQEKTFTSHTDVDLNA